MNTRTTETPDAVCPATRDEIEAAKDAFLSNPGWMHIYDHAPDGAKRRLEVSFWFSLNHGNLPRERAGEMLNQYRAWRTDVEQAMDDRDLEYMVAVIDKPSAKEHYAELLKDRKAALRTPRGEMLMPYDDFFAMLDEQGEFESPACDDETKKSIISGFLPVLEGSGDPLWTHVEDILATAKLKEARIYPKNKVVYVRVETRFLTETAEWSPPYQMLAAWDSHNMLMGYTFPVGKGRRSELPYELENPPSMAQLERRMLLKAERLSA